VTRDAFIYSDSARHAAATPREARNDISTWREITRARNKCQSEPPIQIFVCSTLSAWSYSRECTEREREREKKREREVRGRPRHYPRIIAIITRVILYAEVRHTIRRERCHRLYRFAEAHAHARDGLFSFMAPQAQRGHVCANTPALGIIIGTHARRRMFSQSAR